MNEINTKGRRVSPSPAELEIVRVGREWWVDEDGKIALGPFASKREAEWMAES
jgi:hypothetical protein